MTRPWRNAACLAAGLLGLDLVTKWLAVITTGGADWWLVRPRRNTELALGIFALDMNTAVLAVLGLTTCAILVHSVVLANRGHSPTWAPLLMISGALGNGIDRAATGAVHDWLYMGKVVANVADFVLIAGLSGYVLHAWRAADIDKD